MRMDEAQGSSAMPARLGYMGPQMMTTHGKETNEQTAKDPIACALSRPLNVIAKNESIARGYTRNENAKVAALSATGALTPRAWVAKAQKL